MRVQEGRKPPETLPVLLRIRGGITREANRQPLNNPRPILSEREREHANYRQPEQRPCPQNTRTARCSLIRLLSRHVKNSSLRGAPLLTRQPAPRPPSPPAACHATPSERGPDSGSAQCCHAWHRGSGSPRSSARQTQLAHVVSRQRCDDGLFRAQLYHTTGNQASAMVRFIARNERHALNCLGFAHLGCIIILLRRNI